MPHANAFQTCALKDLERGQAAVTEATKTLQVGQDLQHDFLNMFGLPHLCDSLSGALLHVPCNILFHFFVILLYRIVRIMLSQSSFA